MRKRVFIIVGFLLLFLVGIGIAELVEFVKLNTLEPGEIYKSKNVRVVELEPGLDPKIRIIDAGGTYDEKVAFSDTTVVVTGTVTKVQEVEAFFYYEEFKMHGSSKMTIFEFAVDEYLYTASDALSGKETLRIGTWSSSYNTHFSLPIIKEGKSFLVICKLTSEIKNDSAHKKEYMDCWIDSPFLHLHEGAGSKYILDNIFAHYLSPEDLSINVLGANEEQIKAYARADEDNTASKFGINDPNGLLDVLKERLISWDKDRHVSGDSLLSYAQECYTVDKKAAKDLLVELVKRNN